MKMETLQDYYVEELRDLYDAEKQLLRALPNMAKAASHDELKSAFQDYVEQTTQQANRLEKILQKHGKNARGRKCRAMMGLIEEGKEMMEEKMVPDVLDASLITTAQKVEHYEIAGYGCTATYAKLLGLDEEAELLHKTLEEEKETDGKLTHLAERIVNPDAKEIGDGEGERAGNGRARTQARAGARSATRKSAKRSVSKSAGRTTRAEGDESEAKSTKDLEEIRAWAEARGGKPAHVCGTGNERDPGMLRIDFPGYSGEGTLEEISWEDWYKKFQDNNLTFLYQDKTKDGHESRFFKLVCMDDKKS